MLRDDRDFLHQEIFRQNEEMMVAKESNHHQAVNLPMPTKPLSYHSVYQHPMARTTTIPRNISASDMLLLSTNELQNDRDIVSPSPVKGMLASGLKSPVPSLVSAQEANADQVFESDIGLFSSPQHVFQSGARHETASSNSQLAGMDFRSIASSPLCEYLSSFLYSEMCQNQSG
jgi:hypothetical protein